MNPKIKKIDTIIVIALIIIAAVVLYRTNYLSFNGEKKPTETEEEEITPPPIVPPTSLIPGYMRAVSADDEGSHYQKIRISREWWYFSAILGGEGSELDGWSVAVSFNHMAYGDLFGTLKPDVLVITLNGPNGECYGGIVNNRRGFGILSKPALTATSPGVSVKYGDSWAEGRAPSWHVKAIDNDIDKEHEIVVDLEYFAPSDPVWTVGERAFLKSSSKIANYVFLGCKVNGTVKIDDKEYKVQGTGVHEHSWSPHILTRGSIGGWDWFHMSLSNGWNIYLANYYPTPQFISTRTSRINPFSTLFITTDEGKTLTSLDDINIKITKSDEKVFLKIVTMPSEYSVSAKPRAAQLLLKTAKIGLDLDIKTDNAFCKIWKFPTYVGMKVGMSSINGKLTWSDDDGNYDVELDGLATSWSMRALL
jgi:predicted secreted hydrolase